MSASRRSEDPHTKVGAIVVNKGNRILSSGYNGLVEGKNFDLKSISREDKLLFMVHAESNALDLTNKNDEPSTIYITTSPCANCCLRIASMGIKNIFYKEEYHRCNKYKRILDFYGINYRQINTEESSNIDICIKNELVL